MSKADAHFVDCDINPDSYSWTCQGDESPTVTTFTYNYISENGKLWGVPVGDAALFSAPSGAARDVGGGVVGIPYPNNPFVAGQVVRIAGTTNYNGQYTLGAGTTTSELQITDAYIAETFDGTETVCRLIASLNAGTGRMVQDSSGNMYYGHNWDAVNSTLVTKIATDGTLSYDAVTFPAVHASTTVHGMAITDDDAYLYVLSAVAAGHLRKFDLSTGAVVWSSLISVNVGQDLAIDSDGNAYTGIGTRAYITKFDKDTGAQTTLSSMGQTGNLNIVGGLRWDVAVDDTLGIVIGAGDMYALTSQGAAVHALMYNIGVRTFDNSKGDTIQLGGTYVNGSLTLTRRVATEHIAVRDGYIYVLLQQVDTIYKLQWDGSSINVIASAAGPTYGTGIFFDLWGNLVIVNQSSLTQQTEIFHYYDTDLNSLGSLDNFYNAMLGLWSANVGYPYQRGAVYPNGVLGGVSGTTPTQKRNLWYPSDHSHLNGETVQVLGDGAYLGTETVSGGAVALDDNTTTNHVGLAYTSYLQPMKPDGEVYVKDIRQVFLQLYQTLGGKYGETLDRLWEVVFRDRDDTFGDSPALFTGHKELPFEGSYTRQGDIWVVQDIPLPMTLLGIIMKMEMNDASS